MRNESFRHAKRLGRLYLKSNRFLYPILKRVRDENAISKLCRRDDHLCVEGYPSSGNTFAYNLLSILFPNLEMGHHCHSTANVKIALANKINATVLIRNPYECISPRVVRFSESVSNRPLRNGIDEYLWFYRTIEQMLSDDSHDLVQLLPFKTLIETPSTLACIVTNRVYPDSAMRTEEEIQFTAELAQKCIKEWSQRQHHDQDRDGSLTVSIPSEERTRRKEKVKDRLSSLPAMEQAVELYETLVYSS